MPSRSIIIGALCLLFVSILAFFGSISPAQANSSLTVTTTTDVTDPTDGLCSLREATAAVASGAESGGTLGECPAGSPGDTILVPAGIYTLTQGEIVITTSVTISGSGQADAILDGNSLDRIFEITGTTTAVDLYGLTLQNGQAYVTSKMQDNGGAVFAAGPITITNSTLVSNTASSGGGIYVYTGTQALVEDSDLIRNQSVLGAAIFNAGELVLSHTNILSNTTTDTGAIQNGWYGTPATATVENSTFAGNSAGFGASGILNWISSTLTVTQTSFENNSAINGFGALGNGGEAMIADSSFDHNQAENGAAIYNDFTLSVSNSTFSNNATTGSCGAIQSLNGTADISGSSFNDNSSGYEGGAVCGGVLTLTNTSLTNNTTVANGGAIADLTGDPISADAITVTNNSAQVGGGIFDLGALQLFNSQVISNSASDCGGGILTNKDGTISQTQILSNTADRGGGIFVHGQFVLTESALISNSATSLGGGLYVETGAQASVENSQFISNAATVGGGLYNKGTLTVTASQFISNSVNPIGGEGGGILNESGLQVISSTFTDNFGSQFGGGISTFAPATIISSTFSYNWSAEGGGIGANNTNEDGTAVEVLGSRFDHNGAAWHGGGVAATGNIVIVDSTFNSDSASVCGGAIDEWPQSTVSNTVVVGNSAPQGGGICAEGFMQLYGSTIMSNTATDRGGGIESDMLITVEHSLITGNSTSGLGGGVYNFAFMFLRDSSVTSNTASSVDPASGDGGGIYSYSTFSATNSTVSANTASGQGGGVFDDAGVITLTNSTIANNSAEQDGGGLALTSTSGSANNVTIAGNTANSDNNASGAGGGIFMAPGAQFQLQNTLLASNLDLSGQAPDCAGTLTTGGHNLIQSTLGCTLSGTAAGDITGAAPLLGPLQDNGGSTWTQALLAGSPAIDAGSPATPGSGGAACEATDQRGITRPQGLACDIGAYEAVGLSVTATVQFVGSAFTTTQSAGSVPITVTLSHVMPVTVTVHYSTTDGTALAGTDYVAVNGTLTFTPGVTETAFGVAITPQPVFNTDKAFSVTLDSPAGAMLGTPQAASINILNGHAAPGVHFSQSAYTASESQGAAAITVTLSAASSLTATVHYSTNDGIALAGSDYLATNGTLTFTPGLTQTAFAVPIINDSLHESNETFRVALSNAAGASLGSPETATVTIHDDDPAPSVRFSGAVYTATEGSGTTAITVTLSAASSLTATVHFATSNGTATAGSDYTPVSGTLTFATSQVQQTFMVPITHDMLAEGPETVLLTLSSPVQAALGSPGSATLAILDNDVEHRLYLPFVVGP